VEHASVEARSKWMSRSLSTHWPSTVSAQSLT
jgi:hypothetical protein